MPAIILLRTFLRPGYELFYTQTFDLAVAHLRLLTLSAPREDPTMPLPPLSQALMVIFKEAFPLARRQNKDSPQSLDATGVHLDYAYLRTADLEQVWIPQASLRKADLVGARLMRAELSEANLSAAMLVRADLREARLIMADLSGAILLRADLRGAVLREADLSGATFREAHLGETHLEEALSLKGTDLREVKGLTKEQKATCQARGAIVDEDSTTNTSQSTVIPASSSPSNDVQAQSALPAPDHPPSAASDESATTSSPPDAEP